MAITKFRLSAALAGAMAITLATLGFTATGSASADDMGGPVVYLSEHGAPTFCKIAVSATTEAGQEYSDSLSRPSCDGTLWLPKLKMGSRLKIYAPTGRLVQVTMSDHINEKTHEADNNTAICVLVSGTGYYRYTGMSAKGGSCNGD